MVLRYLQEVKSEFLKINWISLKEVFSVSIVVFFVIMIFSFIFLAFDLTSIEIIKSVLR